MGRTGNNGPDHQALVDDGYARIAWVKDYSAVMNGLVKRTLVDGSLKGKRIAVVVHLEAKTAYLASLLEDGVVLANAGHHDLEVDVEALENAARMASSKIEERAGVTTYRIGDRTIHVLSTARR